MYIHAILQDAMYMRHAHSVKPSSNISERCFLKKTGQRNYKKIPPRVLDNFVFRLVTFLYGSGATHSSTVKLIVK